MKALRTMARAFTREYCVVAILAFLIVAVFVASFLYNLLFWPAL